MVMAVRLIQKLSKETGAKETVSYDTPEILNRALLLILDIERKLVALGIDFFIGTTLVAVARKPTR